MNVPTPSPKPPHCPSAELDLDPPRDPWSHPRHLPHFNPGSETQAITYRLGDAIPIEVARRRTEEMSPDADPAYRRRIEAYLDAGHGSCILRHPEHAYMVIDAWRHFDGERYHLLAWVVMPNHVHVMIQLLGTATLTQIIQSWKSYTGRRLPIGWQREYWDRYIRDEQHYRRTIAYIHDNPVNAELCADPADWPWSSAHRTHCPQVELELDPPGP